MGKKIFEKYQKTSENIPAEHWDWIVEMGSRRLCGHG